MDFKAIFSKRLKNARIMRNLSVSELSARINVPENQIIEYENGKRFPDSKIHTALSKVFGLPLEYFFRPFTLQISGLEFKKDTSLLENETEKILLCAYEKLERYTAVENILEIKPKELQKIFVRDDCDVINSALELRKNWNLGLDGIVNVVEMIENNGIKIIEVETEKSIDGMSGKTPGGSFMLLNKGFLPEKKRFTALHELGHILLDFDDRADSERLCDLFASEMLVPSKVFKQVFFASKSGLRNIQKQFGVSVNVLIDKAEYLGLLSENDKRKFENVEEESLFRDEKSERFMLLVCRAYEKELISLSRGAELLNMPCADFRKIAE